MLKIGIDPPLSWAIADNGYIVEVGTCKSMADLFTWLRRYRQHPHLKEVVIETPHGLGSRLGRGMPVQMQRKISANIGQVYQSAQAIHAFCMSEGMPSRLQKSCKMLTKIKAEKFQQITGFKGKTNKDNRDAAMLVFERKNI